MDKDKSMDTYGQGLRHRPRGTGKQTDRGTDGQAEEKGQREMDRDTDGQGQERIGTGTETDIDTDRQG